MIVRWLRNVLGGCIALVVLFEEWGWEPLQSAIGHLARWPPLAWLERRLVALPPYAALAVFAVPGLALLPVKLGALALVARGHTLLGLASIVAAKLAGTALVARLFSLLQPALMQIGWFARLYRRWTPWKEHWLARVRASAAWQTARRIKCRVREALSRAP